MNSEIEFEVEALRIKRVALLKKKKGYLKKEFRVWIKYVYESLITGLLRGSSSLYKVVVSYSELFFQIVTW